MSLVQEVVVKCLADVDGALDNGRAKVFIGQGDQEVKVVLEGAKQTILAFGEVEFGWCGRG